MDIRLRARVRRHSRVIGGAVGAAILLIGGGTLAATGQNRLLAAPSGVTLEQAEAFVGVTPTRMLDTRQVGSSKFNPGETRTLSFAAYVPPEATSVSLAIVSPSGATAISYFTMWPTGEPRPETSVLNPAPPLDLATSVLLRLGDNRSVDVYNAFGQSDLVVDIHGYFVPLADVQGIGGTPSSEPQYTVGQSAFGGVIFHVDSTGQHGLIAATADEPGGADYTWGDSTISGTAQFQCANKAAIDGYADWFLPDQAQMTLLFTNRYAVGGSPNGGFSNTTQSNASLYWTSTESDNPGTAWFQYFGNAFQSNNPENNVYSVRCIRAF